MYILLISFRLKIWISLSHSLVFQMVWLFTFHSRHIKEGSTVTVVGVVYWNESVLMNGYPLIVNWANSSYQEMLKDWLLHVMRPQSLMEYHFDNGVLGNVAVFINTLLLCLCNFNFFWRAALDDQCKKKLIYISNSAMYISGVLKFDVNLSLLSSHIKTTFFFPLRVKVLQQKFFCYNMHSIISIVGIVLTSKENYPEWSQMIKHTLIFNEFWKGVCVGDGDKKPE